MISVADNFSYQGAKPLDGRLKYDTLAAMKAVADATMYDGCMAYCTGTDKTYQWKSANTVDESTGKWREFSSGGGGGSTYTAGTGIDITNDVISTKQSEEGDIDEIIGSLPSGGRVAVTGYVPLGTVIPVFRETAPQLFLICDGSTYNKADYPELAELLLGLTTHSQYEVDGDNTKFKVPDLRGEFIRGTGTNSHENQGSGTNVGVHQDATVTAKMQGHAGTIYGANTGLSNEDSMISIGSYSTANGSSASSELWNGFTSRPTNTSVLYCIAYKDIYSNPINDYSTEEKIVGTWIDSKPLWQKTFQQSLNLAVSSTDYMGDLTGLNIDYGTVASYVMIDTNGYASALTHFDVWLRVPQNNIGVTNKSTQAKNGTMYVTIQYTKTT